ncbi:MAG: hypothetical protein LBF72_04135 [Holosporales bacterium]|jgi:hypothetical protein|nr:hypothetical protein [Holosporales bacterium]
MEHRRRAVLYVLLLPQRGDEPANLRGLWIECFAVYYASLLIGDQLHYRARALFTKNLLLNVSKEGYIQSQKEFGAKALEPVDIRFDIIFKLRIFQEKRSAEAECTKRT